MPTQGLVSGKGWFGLKISSNVMWSASCGTHFREGGADRNNNWSCTPNHWALQPMENLKLYLTFILVAANGHQHRSFLQIVQKVSDQQNWYAETTGVSTQLANTRQAMAVGGYGLHGTIAPVTRQWLPIGNHWLTHVASTSSTNNDVSNSKRSSMAIY